jgi:hypothetical protein
MKISTKLAGAAAAALALGLTTQTVRAEGPSYDYLGASYVINDLGLALESLDGFRIEGSVGLTSNIHLIGEWLDTSGKPFAGDPKLDFESYRVALGYNHALTTTTDFVTRVGYGKIKVKESGLGSLSDSGYNLEALVRMMVNDQFELSLGGLYEDVGGDLQDEARLTAGFVYTFAQGVAVRGGVESGSADTLMDLGVRWNFGGFRR